MKSYHNKFRYLLYIVVLAVALPFGASAQRMGHGGGARGGGQMSRPSTQQARPATQQTRPASQPSRQPAQQARPSTSDRSQSINGGSQKSPDRNLSASTADRSVSNNQTRTAGVTNIKSGSGQVSTRDVNRGNVGNSNIINSGNRYNQVNIIVRPPVRPYPRPPYAYGGFHYNCFHPYHPYPYHPYYYGPSYNPWGVFVAAVAVTAIIVSIDNAEQEQDGQVYYDSGVYYVKEGNGYKVIQPPPGATIPTLPAGSETVVVNETTNNYYYAGTYYEKGDEGYVVVPPTAGTIVPNLPEGGEEVKIGDITYVKLGQTYYQPVQVNGKNIYEVVNVEPAG